MVKSSLFPKDLEHIITQEARLGIVLGLQLFKSMNLRQLSKFVGKTEPTTYTHVSKLLEQGIIEMDAERIAERGKFYKLSQKGQELLKSNKTVSETLDPDAMDLAITQTLIKSIRSISLVAKNVANYVSTILAENIDEFLKSEDSDKNKMSVLLHVFKLCDDQQKQQFYDMQTRFLETLDEIKRAGENCNCEDNYQIVYYLSVPISEFSPGTEFKSNV